MKKVKHLLATFILAAAPFLTAGVVLADSCDIGFTGPNSQNMCVQTKTFECTVNTNNTVTIDNDNTQIAVTGDATNGGALTGSITNSNGAVLDLTVTNSNTCTLVTNVPATPTPTPEKPTKVTPTKSVEPAVLADTASDNLPQVLVMLGAVAVVIVAATFGVSRIIKR